MSGRRPAIHTHSFNNVHTTPVVIPHSCTCMCCEFVMSNRVSLFSDAPSRIQNVLYDFYRGLRRKF